MPPPPRARVSGVGLVPSTAATAAGAPKSAMIPSPVYWLIVPSKRCTSAVISSKQRLMMRWTSSGSSFSASVVKPATSPKSTVTWRRSQKNARERGERRYDQSRSDPGVVCCLIACARRVYWPGSRRQEQSVTRRFGNPTIGKQRKSKQFKSARVVKTLPRTGVSCSGRS